MRPVNAKGIWAEDHGLFDFADFQVWRETLQQATGGEGEERSFGDLVSTLASRTDIDDEDLDLHAHDEDGLHAHDDTVSEPAYAPSGKGKPIDGGDGSTKGGGGSNKGGGNKTESTDSSDTTSTGGSGSDDNGTTSYDSGAPQYAIDAISSGSSWTNQTITYAFFDTLPSYYSNTSKPGFTAFDADQRQATVDILDGLSQFINVSFAESSVGSSNLGFGNAQLGSGIGGYAYYPGGTATGTAAGDVWINNQYASQLNPVEGNLAYVTLLHEIGHAMGLTHPHDGTANLPAGEDTRQFTVESYNKHATMGSVEPQTYMLYDIAALQEKYGANMSWATGDDVYDFSSAHNLISTIWDAGGIDTFDASARTEGVEINLNAGTFSSIGTRGTMLADNNIAIAYGVTIENAIGGAGHDTIIGNAADNIIVGGGGSDYLIGGGGSDLFRFDVDWGDDTIADFEDGLDLIDFGGTGLSFADFTVSGDNGHSMLVYGSSTIALAGFDVSFLDQNDFLFS